MVPQHFLGKEKVPGTNLGVRSTTLLRPDYAVLHRYVRLSSERDLGQGRPPRRAGR